MKLKNILLILAVLLTSIFATAQRGRQHQHRHFDIEAFKKKQADFYQKELDLTDTEMKGFLPLLEEFMDKRFILNRDFRHTAREYRNSNRKTTEEEYQNLIDSGIDVKIKEAELLQEYYIKFRKILSAEKVCKYHRAEKKFMREALRFHKEK